MIIITNQVTGEKVKVTSWKNPSDPAVGIFSGSLQRLSVPEVFVWNQTQPYWRSGEWNGQVFIGLARMYTTAYLNGFSVREDNGTDPICSCLRGFEPKNRDEWDKQNWTSGCVRREALKCERSEASIGDGFVKLQMSKVPDFALQSSVSVDTCRTECLNKCSCTAYACDAGIGCMSWGELIDIVRCLMIVVMKITLVQESGNSPENDEQHDDVDDQQLREDFDVPIDDVDEEHGMSQDEDLSDASEPPQVQIRRSNRQREPSTRTECLNKCSCTAYACDAGIGCMSWGELIDIVRFSTRVEELIFTPAKLLQNSVTRTERQPSMVLSTGESHPENRSAGLSGQLKQVNIEDVPVFNFENIATSTNHFNLANKLGQGGFGAVYKGELQNGQEVAVKRLPRASRQGTEEFMNEVTVISKLQHRNLVRLLGCCIEGGEKMLIFEYMPNKSLDFYLFDSAKKSVLDWQKRFNIIEGISRGLLYLHRDSRLRPEANIYLPFLFVEAWKLWNEEEIESLIDPEIFNTDSVNHTLRCIHIGLLCVQELAKERPTMATVVSMLNGDIVNFAPPRQPAFIQRQIEFRGESSQQSHESNSINNVTVTNLQGR
ncbi:hypothetical protein VNO80_28578 [Phaseolus coccineus]|uniref:Uncharacterized protein n=1 Tax=Phaseolus coccineus TaxID=3886 RepID=A0AAN9LBS5_PHACN